MGSPTRSSRAAAAGTRSARTLLALAALATVAGLTTTPAATATGGKRHVPTRRFSACLATDNGLGSTFDRLAAAGLRDAAGAGVTGYERRSSTPTDDVATVRACLSTGASITVGVGAFMANAIDVVATANPARRFAVVDVDTTSLTHRPGNVTGIVLESQQAGYLVGYAAGLWVKDHAKLAHRAIGSVGSLAIPPVDRYIAGFRFGARKADPGVTLFNDYAEDTVDPASCRRQALAEIAKGAEVVFEVAGPCGRGVLEAARAKGVLSIGTDTDLSGFGPSVLTSALKRVDIAMRDTILLARKGDLRGGTNVPFGADEDGIGYGRWSPRVSTRIRAAVAAQYVLLRTGRIRGIPTRLG